MSKKLLGLELRYSLLKQLVLALLVATQKIHSYFQAHSIVVLNAYLLRSMLNKLNLLGQMLRWSVELSEYDISCKPGATLK